MEDQKVYKKMIIIGRIKVLTFIQKSEKSSS